MPDADRFAKKYLARGSLWRWRDDASIDLLDIEGRTTAELGNWQTIAFQAADGSTTAEELVASLHRNYRQQDLDFYAARIAEALEVLAGGSGPIRLNDRKDDLPDYFELPLDQQDREEPAGRCAPTA